MKWKKLGLVYEPIKSLWWQQHYAILPTPIYFEKDNLIRVFFATTCKEKYGRITYIDLDADNPLLIKNNPLKISLDIGQIGSFDDCGVNPSCLMMVDNKLWMYYAGYQRHFRTPYSIFSSLAISDDFSSFYRFCHNPILDRTDLECSLRSAPTVIKTNTGFFMIYVSDLGWQEIKSAIFDNKMLPKYCLRSATSTDGLNWVSSNTPLFELKEDEFGFGRPYLFNFDNIFYLFYSIRRKNTTYRIGYAKSEDLQTWTRLDNQIGIDISEKGWDSEMICYPSVISIDKKVFMFYNGNSNGETGFGVAELIEK